MCVNRMAIQIAPLCQGNVHCVDYYSSGSSKASPAYNVDVYLPLPMSLSQAARHGQHLLVEALVAAGADLEQANKVGHRPIHEAALWTDSIPGGGSGNKTVAVILVRV